MTERQWKSLLRSLPDGLSFKEAADRLCLPYQQVRLAIQRHKYRAVDGRAFSQKRRFSWHSADWRKSNVELAKQFGVSRERIRVLRDELGHRFVESRGRKKNR